MKRLGRNGERVGRGAAAARSMRDLLPIAAIVGATALGVTAIVGPATSDIRALLVPVAAPVAPSATPGPATGGNGSPLAIEIRDAFRTRSLAGVTRLPVLAGPPIVPASSADAESTVRLALSPDAAVLDVAPAAVEEVAVVVSAASSASVATEPAVEPVASSSLYKPGKKIAAKLIAKLEAKSAKAEAKATKTEGKADANGVTHPPASLAGEPPRGKALGTKR